jgi:hypothetical protein
MTTPAALTTTTWERPKPAYLIYWRDRDYGYTGNIYVYNVATGEEETFNRSSIFYKFPVPKNGPSMWGTPLGHLRCYNTMVSGSLTSYEENKRKYR